jgi:hypothetical protein
MKSPIQGKFSSVKVKVGNQKAIKKLKSQEKGAKVVNAAKMMKMKLAFIKKKEKEEKKKLKEKKKELKLKLKEKKVKLDQ